MTTTPITLLDGGMGQEIVNRGGKVAFGEWAVAALHEDPALVHEIHCDYLRAGADVLTTNTYGTTRARLRHVGREDRLADFVRKAGELASRARDEAGRPETRIAACLPPLEGSYLHEFALNFEQTRAEFAELIALLAPYVDILLGETFSTRFEGRAFLEAAEGSGKTVWLSFTLDDAVASDGVANDGAEAHLRGGETLEAALAGLRPDALLLNCCKPATITRALPTLAAMGRPFGAYANGFTGIPDSWEADGGVTQLAAEGVTPDAYAREVAGWLGQGATIVGGCCEMGPAHIARLRQLIDDELIGHSGL